MYEYFIDSIPPSLNAYLGKSGKWYKYQADKKKWDLLMFVSISVNRPEKPLPKARVILSYHFPDNRRRDADNYSGKLILDPLVKYGVLQDDSFKNVKLELMAEFKSETPGLNIFIEELL